VFDSSAHVARSIPRVSCLGENITLYNNGYSQKLVVCWYNFLFLFVLCLCFECSYFIYTEWR